MRIEELIRKNPLHTDRGDFLGGATFVIHVAADHNENGDLHVYVHPEGRDGDTEDFIVRDNIFFPLNYADKLPEQK